MRRKDFFTYTAADRLSIVLLAALALLAVVLVARFGKGHGQASGATAADSTQVATDSARAAGTAGAATAAAPVAEGPRLFAFDPNTADSATLTALGLSAQVARNVCRYRQRGGVFRQPLDLARIYGITIGQYERLEPYITIGRQYQPASVLVDEAHAARAAARDTTRHLGAYPTKLSPGEQVAINAADTALFMRVPGIGPYFARQIVRHGERLGGYVSTGQLMEIEGFPPEAMAFFRADSVAPRRLKVNSMSLADMRRHPYMTFRLARAIIDYRREQGPLTSLNEVALAAGLTSEQLQRLLPYVEF